MMSVATLLPPPTPAPSAAVGPKPHRFTLAEYRKLALTGLFNDKKTMLLHGELYVMPMPDPAHDTALNLTNEYLRNAFPTDHHVRNQQSFDIGADNDPGPDLAVVRGSIRDYASHPPTTAVSGRGSRRTVAIHRHHDQGGTLRHRERSRILGDRPGTPGVDRFPRPVASAGGTGSDGLSLAHCVWSNRYDHSHGSLARRRSSQRSVAVNFPRDLNQ